MKTQQYLMISVFILSIQFLFFLSKGLLISAISILYLILTASIIENIKINEIKSWIWIGISCVLGIIIGFYCFKQSRLLGIIVMIYTIMITGRNILAISNKMK